LGAGSVFRRLISRDEALQRIRRYVKLAALGVEEVELRSAFGRVLAEDVRASVDVPPFHRATMDGYAVKAKDTFGASETNPKSLRVVGSVEVGKMPATRLETGQAMAVATGSALPEGSDAVLPLEWTRTGSTPNEILALRAVTTGENVMERGHDIKRGELLLKEGTRLTARELGVLSALGIARVKVYLKPKVAILSTGQELVEPGKPLTSGKIYDVNWITLYASVLECGGRPEFLGIVEDSVEKMENTMRKGLEMADVVVASGATSVGATDIMRSIVNRLGKPGVIVDGVRMKPGKPTIIGVADGKPIFCLPGNPMSALVAFYNFVAPVLRAMAGLPPVRRRFVEAVLAGRVMPASGRLTTIPVRLEKGQEQLVAHPILKASGAITALALADGYVEIPEDVKFLESGERVKVYLFRGEWKP